MDKRRELDRIYFLLVQSSDPHIEIVVTVSSKVLASGQSELNSVKGMFQLSGSSSSMAAESAIIAS